MNDHPNMPLDCRAYIMDTRHLSDAEHGRYLLMLMALWVSPGQRFPNDDAWLARKFGKTEDEVREHLRPLIREFFHDDGNWLYQKRVQRTHERVVATSAKQSARAKSRWNKGNGESRGNADVHCDPALPTHARADSESISTESESKIPPVSPSGETSPAAAGASSAAQVAPKPAARANKPKASEWTRLPDGWQATEDQIVYAVEQGFTRTEALGIAANFRAYWTNQRGVKATKRNWDETWQVWVRREAERASQRPGARASPAGGTERSPTNVLNRFVSRMHDKGMLTGLEPDIDFGEPSEVAGDGKKPFLLTVPMAGNG